MNKSGLTWRAALSNQSHHLRLVHGSLIGALLGLVCGTVFPIFGLLFLAIAWVEGYRGGWLNALGSILMLATIPLLLIGGCCLDLLDSQKQAHLRRSGHER